MFICLEVHPCWQIDEMHNRENQIIYVEIPYFTARLYISIANALEQGLVTLQGYGMRVRCVYIIS